MWGEVIRLAWFDAVTRNDTRAIQFFYQKESVFADIAAMWSLPVEAIRERLTSVLADKQVQKHIDKRRYRRSNGKNKSIPPAPVTAPITQTGWRTSL